MKYFVSAGEASGDIHGAALIEQISLLDKEAEFAFLGGDAMASATGHAPVIDYRRMAFMGFSEVLRNLRVIMDNFRLARHAIDEAQPDAIILIDYPSFNMRLAAYAHKKGIPVYYYILPKVWAWKSFRVKKLRRYATRLLSILPFEPGWFAMRGTVAEYVGNPSLEESNHLLGEALDAQEFREKHGLTDRPILALVPGSRLSEIRNNLPVMDEVARRHPEMQTIVAAAPGVDPDIYRAYTHYRVVSGVTFQAMLHSDVALVTSGTATLECALAGTPQIACYRANGSRLSYSIMKRLIKCHFITLPNLIVGKEVIPEMLLHNCTPESIEVHFSGLMHGRQGRANQLEGYGLMRQQLGTGNAPVNAARIIVGDLLYRKKS